MTIYEQIQNAVEFIEKNLFEKLTYSDVATNVCMSSRNFYNYFWSITGYTYKEYVKKRRLTESIKMISNSKLSISDIAFDIGYESHEAFTRAFKQEYGISPREFRLKYKQLEGLKQIKLINEIYMKTIIKELTKMKIVCFEGFAPEPENKARNKMNQWLKMNHLENGPYRIFGHNIDLEGNISYVPKNEGYKFMVTIDDNYNEDLETKIDFIEPGRFVVTGIEGNMSDGDGKWIMEGWARLNKMIKQGNYIIKKPIRWFEEELEPSKPGNLRLDLYLEVE